MYKNDSLFNSAFNYMLKNEGGFVNDTADKGGATKYGVSLALMKQMFKNGSIWLDLNGDGVVDDKDVSVLTEEEAKAVYYKEFWRPLTAFSNLFLAQIVTKIFDTAVNIGVKNSIKLVQRVVGTQADGLIGKETISKCITYKGDFLSEYIEFLVKFYVNIVVTNPTQLKFLNGWINRAFRYPN